MDAVTLPFLRPSSTTALPRLEPAIPHGTGTVLQWQDTHFYESENVAVFPRGPGR